MRVLLDAVERHHPDAARYAVLADRPDRDAPRALSGAVLVPADELGVPGFPRFAFRHEGDEFAAALRPFAFRSLLGRGHRAVVLLEAASDDLLAPLDALLALLEADSSLVLAPLVLSPTEDSSAADGPDDRQTAPIVLAARAGAETDDLLGWWSARLVDIRYGGGEDGLAPDRRVVSRLPLLGSRVRVLRDPGTVLTEATAGRRGLHRADGHWRVAAAPLRSVRFGDDDDAAPDDAFAALGRDRARRIAAAEAASGRPPEAAYGYGRFGSGTPIPPIVRRIFRESPLVPADDPFRSFERQLADPSPDQWAGSTEAIVTRLMEELRRRDDTLRTRFDVGTREGVAAYADWFSRFGEIALGGLGLASPVAGRLATRPAVPRRRPPAAMPSDTADVTVVSYLRAASGVGEAGRLVLRALDRSGWRARGVETRLNIRAPLDDESCAPLLVARADSRFLVLNVNCDQLPLVLDALGPALRGDSYRVLMPFWELADLPERWAPNLDLVDELWAPTRFIGAALRRRTNRPVVAMPLPLALSPPSAPRASRAALGLPDGRFLFFFAFDVLSFPQRKNPMAVVRAFRLAFPSGTADGGRPVGLVIKALNRGADPHHDTGFLDAFRDDPRISVIERPLSRDDMLAFLGFADVVVSLHRSEGLGLLVAEAMALGVPVIATDWSGTTELLDHSTGFPVDARLVPVGPGEYPFGEGQVWAEPDEEHAAFLMREIVRDGAEARRRAERARARVGALTLDHAGAAMRARLEEIERGAGAR